MVIDRISMTQFRNYESRTFEFHPKMNVIVGLNGVGKTNILDAIYYLCLGKSYFSSLDKMVIMQDADFFRLEGIFKKGYDQDKVVIKSKSGSRKEIAISGKVLSKISEHIGRFLCVIISPDDVQMMLDGSEVRRNFVNNTIIQTDGTYLEDLMLYGALLKRRNALLKTFADKNSFDKILLESVTAPMYEPAQRIFERREKFVHQMNPIFAETYGEISGHKETCSIIYHSQMQKASLRELVMKSLDKDKILARSTQGIHKDDLIFTMNGEPLKYFASQGQLKSFILALKITQYKLLEANSGQKPILLLDDIFDKLDKNRVLQLLNMLMDKNFGQVFITDTDSERISSILNTIGYDYQLLTIASNSVENNNP